MTTKAKRVYVKRRPRNLLVEEPSSADLLDFYLRKCQYQTTGNGRMHMSLTVPRSTSMELSSKAKRRSALVSAYREGLIEERSAHYAAAIKENSHD